jgi:hypothetical protein
MPQATRLTNCMYELWATSAALYHGFIKFSDVLDTQSQSQVMKRAQSMYMYSEQVNEF